jgi:hypothetical protein
VRVLAIGGFPSSRLPVISLSLALALAGCESPAPPRGPEAACASACASRASQCGPDQCRRGCNLVLDRLVERESDGVVACVARSAGPCDDRAWARCAALVGPHADGGPPPPPPPAVRDPD